MCWLPGDHAWSRPKVRTLGLRALRAGVKVLLCNVKVMAFTQTPLVFHSGVLGTKLQVLVEMWAESEARLKSEHPEVRSLRCSQH